MLQYLSEYNKTKSLFLSKMRGYRRVSFWLKDYLEIYVYIICDLGYFARYIL